MSYLTIKTNVKLNSGKRKTLIKERITTLSSQLGKAENYVMISFNYCEDMIFGSSNEPLAYLEFKNIGLAHSQTANLSKTLSQLLALYLSAPTKRVYIKFSGPEYHL
ncbi:MAG: hypothetical protein GXP21_08110 [Gammaproteobacteria bacterium]|nr:hypothetical protein [Gammaproteobacteria bacterium]